MIVATCHCGQVRIEIDAAPPETVTDCNCSLCRRIGGWWAYYTPDQVRITAGEGHTVAYVQGDRTLETHHCPTCGCVTHWRAIASDYNRMGVNARLFDPADLKDVRVRHLDGADTWDYLD
jgi:hypothetical protein